MPRRDPIAYSTSNPALHVRPLHLGPNDPRVVLIHLRDIDSIDNPASTSGRRIYGPATATLILWPDGGKDLDVRPGWFTEDGEVDSDSPLGRWLNS